ncbi:MAG TPA: ArgE/DapE family deacylase [Gemmatimonadales bacterium]|nr:ArgE/DapE family deacylase [Gemmatimonadales bacterium]
MSRDAIEDVSDTIAGSVDSLRSELFAFAQRLVRTPSLPGEEQEVQTLIAAKLRDLELHVDIVPSRPEELATHPAFCDDGVPSGERINVVGRWAGSASQYDAGDRRARSLIVNGHVDVVPTGDEALWADPPWSGAVKDGKLYGRGSCDMKAGLASAIFALEALQVLGYHPQGEVLVESVIGEETGGIGTLTTIVKGYRADAAIIMEPTRLRPCPVQAGALTFRLQVPGRSVHACMKTAGVSAIETFCRILEALNELERDRQRSYHNPLYAESMLVAPISCGTIRGGDWHSTVPGEVIVEGRYGVLPGESVEAARRVLSNALQEAAAKDPWLRYHPPTLEWLEGQFESGQTDSRAPIVGTLVGSHRIVTGEAPRLEGVTYGSDLRLFTNHANIPAVLYGPGNVANAHTVDEFVELQDIVTSTKVLALTIYQWCGAHGRP